MEETMSRMFPFKIENVDTNQREELLKYFKGETTGFVRVGPKGYLLPQKYREEGADIYNMPLRAGDVFVDSYPRSGTTVTQELVWMVGNNLDYEKSRKQHLNERFPFLELSVLFDAKVTQQLIDENRPDDEKLKKLEILLRPGTEKLAAYPSPRYIKTHIPLSLLPAATLDTAKVVYVARDPRDVAVSFYHLNKLFRILGFGGDFKSFWRFFVDGLVHWAPYFDHVKEAWQKRHHPNMLFLFYEDIVKDLPQAVRRVSTFLEKQYSEEQTAQLCEYLRFDNFKDNKSVNKNLLKELRVFVPGQQAFIRKGKSGGWREYFDEEMSAQAQRWIDDNLRGSDLRFPNNE